MTTPSNIEHDIERSVHAIEGEIKKLFAWTDNPDAQLKLIVESKGIYRSILDLQDVYNRIGSIKLQAAE